MSSRDVEKLAFDDIEPGDVFTIERVFSEEDVNAFAALSGDFSPLHVDADYAGETEFGQRVVHGMLLASLFSNLVGMHVPGERALYLGQDLVFRKPVFIDQKLTAKAKVTAKNPGTRTIVLATEIRNAEDKVVVSGSGKVKVRESDTWQSTETPASRAASGVSTRAAIVTGASRGIGAEIAWRLAANGFHVAVNYSKSAKEADGVVESIRAAGSEAVAIQADVRDTADLDRLFATAAESLGTPTVLVNAAVGELESHKASELGWKDFQRHLDYQVKAVLETCQRAYPLMAEAGGGSIINVLSQVVQGVPPGGISDYITAKYALLGLSKSLAVEWAGDNIRVNMISPGLTRTALTEHYHERVFKMEAAKTPLRRLATPDDIAHAVAFLTGEHASFLTGVNLFVTGGQVML